MKKLFLASLLLISIGINAQGFGTKEYFTFSVAIDPNATIKEKSPNLVSELELVNYWMYVKASTQILPNLEGGYFDMAGGLGINVYLDRFETIRTYAGGRLGLIKRGGKTYPLSGLEVGIDSNLTENIFVGLRATGDYRSDFEFWGGEAETRYSGFLRIGVKF